MPCVCRWDNSAMPFLGDTRKIALRPSVRLRSIDDVVAWAEDNGGDAAVRVALADRRIRSEASVRVAEAWLAIQQDARADHHDDQSLDVSRQALALARQSARYSLYAVLVATAAAIVSAATYWLTRVPG